MLQMIMNTLKNGDSKTKGYLISVIALWIVTIGLFLAAVFSGSPLLGVAAFGAAVIAFAMMSDLKVTMAKGGKKGAKKKTGNGGKKNAAAKDADGRTKGTKESRENADAEEEDADGEEKEDGDAEEDSDNPYASLTEEKIKQLLVKYKVKQEHVPVIIDLCASERVKQCPGFAWTEGSSLKVLLIEAKPRMIECDTSRIRELSVERGISVRASAEYPELRESELMKRLYTQYLPRYHKKDIGGRIVLFKNLYVLGNDLKFTSGSIRPLLKILPVGIDLNERRMQESNVSIYYKELYTVSFLWKDGIYSLDEFKEKLEKVLQDMVSAEIPYAEFENNLSEMISDGLLPMEYRDYAYQLREKKNAPPEPEQKKGLFGKKKK